MSSDIAMSVRGLAKSYVIRHNQQRHTTLGEAFLYRLKHPLERSEREEFWALDDVEFEVHQGEVLGVIGRNGAGKSTLLKVLSRITSPTRGEVHVYGRVGSLLEVGTGFHPELTGRENIYLNGSILGMRRREIDQRFDEIVDFAGVEQFLDTPVKRYSSGMYVRLAFAVAAHLETEILLLDEVLAVGDAAFQERCFTKVRDLGASGRTVLLVSHNMGAIRNFSNRAIVFDAGSIAVDGSTSDAIEHYRVTAMGSRSGRPTRRGGSLGPTIGVVALGAAPTRDAPSLRYQVELRGGTHASAVRISHSIWRDDGVPVANGMAKEVLDLLPTRSSQLEVAVALPHLAPGSYDLNVAISEAVTRTPVDYIEGAATFGIWADEQSSDLERIWDPRWGTVVLLDAAVVPLRQASAR